MHMNGQQSGLARHVKRAALGAAFLMAGALGTAPGMATADEGGNCCLKNPTAARASALVGVWEPMENPRNLPQKAPPRFTPAAQKSVDHQIELRDSGKITYDYSAICIPPSSATMTTLGPQELLVDEKKMTWLIEAVSGMRWVWLDGREHPPLDELRFTANGHSVGRWEDDVFVIDSVGFMDKAMVYMNMLGNISIYPSPQMRFIERIRLIEDGQAMVSERTLIDPVNLEEPWVTTVRYERRDWEIGETICMENNQVFFYFEPDELPNQH
ncbi:hypothetical protein [Elongatibacter sediminis]|uniref:Uncharacterized protein n=1 Tax=Elongatibacter sediminis TaxID=3119006 RepID=A0AAW9R9E5_9GAMM